MATIEELQERIEDLEIDRDLAKAELEGAQAKIDKAEARKDRVKPEIYEKVVGEYVAARDAAQAKLDEVEAAIGQAQEEAVALETAEAEAAARAEREAREAEEAARRAEEEAHQAEEARRAAEAEQARLDEERRKAEEEETARREEEVRARAEEEARLAREEEELRRLEEEERHKAEDDERRIAQETVDELTMERDELAGSLGGPAAQWEELQFRKEMEEFDSDEEFDAQAGPIRDEILGTRGRIDAIQKEIVLLAEKHGLEAPAPAALPEGLPGGSASAEEPAAAPEAPEPIEEAVEDTGVEVEETVVDESPAAVAAAAEVVEETLSSAPVASEVVEEELSTEEGWNDVEKRFFEASTEHRFFVNPSLILLDSGGGEKIYELIHDTMVIGSAGLGDVDVFIDNKTVDKKHARLKLEHGGYVIKDLRSRSGTFINGKRVRKERLKHLDKIKVGDVFLQVRLM